MAKKKPAGEPRMNKKAFAVAANFEEAAEADRRYWAQQSTGKRWAALEFLRRMNYGRKATQRLQRFLEVVQSKTS